MKQIYDCVPLNFKNILPFVYAKILHYLWISEFSSEIIQHSKYQDEPFCNLVFPKTLEWWIKQKEPRVIPQIVVKYLIKSNQIIQHLQPRAGHKYQSSHHTYDNGRNSLSRSVLFGWGFDNNADFHNFWPSQLIFNKKVHKEMVCHVERETIFHVKSWRLLPKAAD